MDEAMKQAENAVRAKPETENEYETRVAAIIHWLDEFLVAAISREIGTGKSTLVETLQQFFDKDAHAPDTCAESPPAPPEHRIDDVFLDAIACDPPHYDLDAEARLASPENE
jgi:hypothetical protein